MWRLPRNQLNCEHPAKKPVPPSTHGDQNISRGQPSGTVQARQWRISASKWRNSGCPDDCRPAIVLSLRRQTCRGSLWARAKLTLQAGANKANHVPLTPSCNDVTQINGAVITVTVRATGACDRTTSARTTRSDRPPAAQSPPCDGAAKRSSDGGPASPFATRIHPPRTAGPSRTASDRQRDQPNADSCPQNRVIFKRSGALVRQRQAATAISLAWDERRTSC